MMTRKDYVATAGILNRYYTKTEMSFEQLVEEFTKMFLADNERFNTRIFYSAVFGEDD